METTRGIDERAFGELAERCRPELRVHCYRMLGSLEDADDAVQEALLRAWRGREGYRGTGPARAWLYGIATHAAIDAARRRRVARGAAGGPEGVPWLRPLPDAVLERAAPAEEEPGAALVARETVELAFMVAVQHLPPVQRAVLLLRDVAGWSAREAADQLGTSVAAVNSALQRARAALRRHLPGRRSEWAPGGDAEAAERELVRRYMEATERDDVDGLLDVLAEDVRFSMPPEPGVVTGRDAVVAGWVEGGFTSPGWGRWRCLPTRMNGQPAVAGYVRRPGDDRFRPMAVDVLRIAGGRVAEVVAYPLADLLQEAGLPAGL
nr:RNA polymerase subunit sigma-70 [Miltoncostaea marina]